jgi:carbon-monoxide dehydrogenase medium subunit
MNAMAAFGPGQVYREPGVKAPKFSYVRAASLGQVLELLERYGEEAQILAGGQSLMPALNMRLSAPRLLVDINGIAALQGITCKEGVVRIGALARHAEVATSASIRQCLPLIAAAMPHVAHLAVRNRGTFGGSIALADPAAELPACAVALDARFVLQSLAGRREVAAADFFKRFLCDGSPAQRAADRGADPGATKLGSRLSGAGAPSRRFCHRRCGLSGAARRGHRRRRPLGLFCQRGAADARPRHAGGDQGQRLDQTTTEAAVSALPKDLAPIGNAAASAKLRLHLQGVLTRRALHQAQATITGNARP